jgi:tetratricopeptide (TPR) repeat protein
MLSDPDEGEAWRASAAAILAGLPDERAGDVLGRFLHDPEPLVRRWAAEGVGNHGIGTAGPDLLGLLHDPGMSVRIQAALAITKLGMTSEMDDDARASLRVALSEFDGLTREAQADDPEAQVKAGYHYVRAGRMPEAEAAFNRSLATGTGIVGAYAGLAGIAFDRGEYESSSTFWKLAADRDPTLTPNLMLACERWASELTERIEIRPTAVDYCFLGDSHVLRKSLEEAIKCYAMALALNPRHPRSLRNKTLCLIDAGKGKAARQAFSEYRRLSGETNEVAQIRWMIDRMGHE